LLTLAIILGDPAPDTVASSGTPIPQLLSQAVKCGIGILQKLCPSWKRLVRDCCSGPVIPSAARAPGVAGLLFPSTSRTACPFMIERTRITRPLAEATQAPLLRS